MNVLVICQGPAYGDEHSYNGLRLAGALAKRDDTDVKVFLTADPSVRAQRRAAERIEGRDASPQATESALMARDAKDSSRAVSPLTRADGAIEIDTTNLSFDEVVAAVIELARQVAR